MATATLNGKAPTADTLVIPPIQITSYRVRIVGDSPLICHAWSHKAKEEMLGKQMGKAASKKEPKDPQRDYEEAFYRLPSGAPGFPTIAFKAAAVDAASQVSGVTKVFLRGAFHTVGELTEIEGEPRPREDMVRVGMGTADIRFRPEFPEWATWLTVRLNSRAITLEQLLSLFNQAGFSVGIGEWRPAKDGPYGMFHVDGAERI